jgi:hypothetical protein
MIKVSVGVFRLYSRKCPHGGSNEGHGGTV